MDPYSSERWLLERHRAMVDKAERRARLDPEPSVSLRAWMAGHLRLMADRLEGAPVARAQRPTA